MCKVVHCKKEFYDIYIGRGFKGRKSGIDHRHFGNPFTHKKGTLADIVLNTREEAIKAYRDWLLNLDYKDVNPEQQQWIINNMCTLKGKILGCWCKPLACHGDVLIELMDKPVIRSYDKSYIMVEGHI